MIVHSDLSQAVSTQFQSWVLDAYNDTLPVDLQRLSNLIVDVDLPNFQGNRISLNWLGAAPAVREWIDEKHPVGIRANDWEVVVRRWEASMEFDLDALLDARWNMYEPRIREMVRNARRHGYQLLSDLIRLGTTGLGYDGQYFFDTDHSEGESGTQSNLLTGSGTALDQIRTDYYAAKAALMRYLDDKAEPVWTGDFRPLIWAPANATMMERFETLRKAGLVAGVTSGAGGDTNILSNEFDVMYDPKATDANDWVMLNPDGPMKPFIRVNREPFHYEDNWAGGSAASPDVFNRRIGISSVVGRDAMAYGEWRRAVRISNS